MSSNIRPAFKSLLRPLLLLIATVIVVHGIWGPQFAPKNLATLLVWVHYRGLLVIGVLLFGNLLCAACPLVWVRDVGRLFTQPKRKWPRLLRNKWLATILFILALFSYEAAALWSAPLATALLVLAFFIGVLAVDLIFQDAAFCKYVCPVGQFNFLASMLSPFTIAPKSYETCRNCKTHDCIKGGRAGRGCELKLFVPEKPDNFDCTFCMDCKRACPHDNVSVVRRMPGAGLTDDAFRPGTGKLWSRLDFNALVLVFVFGAIFNAFAMVTPARDFANTVMSFGLGQNSTLGLALIFVFVLLVGPVVLLTIATLTSQLWGLPKIFPRKLVLQRFISALIPLGFGIWAAHYAYHFLTGALTFVPILWNLLPLPPVELGTWARFQMGLPTSIVMPIQMGLLFLGVIGSLATAQTIARQLGGTSSQLKVALPWQALILFLAAFSVWIFSLPMDMRGTFLGG